LDLSAETDIENNETVFCSLWTSLITIGECADIFINRNLFFDYFFNRWNSLCSNNVQSTIEEVIDTFLKMKINCCLYIKDNRNYRNSNLEQLLIKKGFSHIDSLQTMVLYTNESHNLDAHSERKTQGFDIINNDKASQDLWCELFCRSFDVFQWRYEVKKIVNNNFNRLVLLASYLENRPVGCCALFEHDNILGLYCLGTLHSFRHAGFASKMILRCLEIARERGFDFIILQTFESENLIEFYLKNKFETLYTKKLYALIT
jgi:GNAT superfamily N-acetyltransferase